MSQLNALLRSLYEQPKLNDLSDVPSDILLYVPNLLRLVGVLFCIVGIGASIPYLIEHQYDGRLILVRLIMIAYAFISTTLTFVL